MATQRLPQYPVQHTPATPSHDVVEIARPETTRDAGYYNIPFLKRPLWGWEIELYFSCEGISAGAYVLSAMAELFGGGQYRGLVRSARYLSFVFIVPAPPLLIADLGRPERFHHMLRVFKPLSPMNLGAWALTAYSLPVTLLAAQQATQDNLPWTDPVPEFFQHLPTKPIAVAGLPGAMTMISYPGVLLSTTSTPVWTRSRFLGALISCSSISMAAAALSFVAEISEDTASVRVLQKIERAAVICESGALAGYLATSGETARPLVAGKYATHFWMGAVLCGLVLPSLLPARRKKSFGLLRSALKLVGGFALKWALTHSGRESALNPKDNRAATRPSKSAPGWMPSPGAQRTMVNGERLG